MLHDRGDATFAARLLASLQKDAMLTVGDNEPDRMDLIDYTVPRHAYPSRRLYVELKLRQDLIASEAGQSCWASRLAKELDATSA